MSLCPSPPLDAGAEALALEHCTSTREKQIRTREVSNFQLDFSAGTGINPSESTTIMT